MVKISVISPSIRPKGLEITLRSLKEQTFTDFEWIVELGIGQKHDLNAALNRAIKRSNGELVVFLQDYIKIAPDALQRFWDAYTADPKKQFIAPVGKVNNLYFTGEIAWDWRHYKLGETTFNHNEIDWGAIPKELLYEVGGFDEYLDQWWSMDNVSLGYRLHLLGYKFENIDNPALAYDHDAFMEHPFRDKYNPREVNMRMEEYKMNPRLEYLDLL